MATSENSTAVVSIIKNFNRNIENTTIQKVFEIIKSHQYKAKIDLVRDTYEKHGKEAADEVKSTLLAFTPSGIFEKGRKAKDIEQYNGHVILDIDGLSKSNIEDFRKKAIYCQYSHLVFVSPSGRGLKIIAKVSSTVEYHKLAFQQLSDYYEQVLETEVDPSGKDVCRLCFFSHDPECFINVESETFTVNIESAAENDKPNIFNTEEYFSEHLDDEDSLNDEAKKELFEKCVTFTQEIKDYKEGNRNNFIFQLACNCNRIGLPQVDCLAFTAAEFNDISTHEIKKCVESAYVNNASEFASFAKFADLQSFNVGDISNTPTIPKGIIEALPSILREGCEPLESERERDVFITGALGVLSGCLNNFKGQYRGDEVYANLFSFVIAPAANGKGALNYARALGQTIHATLINESVAKAKDYKREMTVFKKTLLSRRQNEEALEEPEKPPFRTLFIPANNSSAKVIKDLNESDGLGIFCETEADTMGNTLKQDWGGYSDLLRKAFQHENISYSRKTGDEWVEVPTPRLSVALAGTPNQVVNLIANAEDGLFSRFIFYVFKSEIKWIRANATKNGFNTTKHYQEIAKKVDELYKLYEGTQEFYFELTDTQWDKLNDFGQKILLNSVLFVSEDASGTSKRMGLILYRIAMIITALRYYDNAEFSVTLTCSDEDFESALALAEVYYQHSVTMFYRLPKESEPIDPKLKQLYKMLPNEFTRKQAIRLGKNQLAISDRTIDTLLGDLVKQGQLNKPKAGHYVKINKEE